MPACRFSVARVLPAAGIALLSSVCAHAVTATRAPFGTLAGGVPIEVVTLTNKHGVSARVISYGATLQTLNAPDRNGHSADILLGYDDLAGYVQRPNYFGATV